MSAWNYTDVFTRDERSNKSHHQLALGTQCLENDPNTANSQTAWTNSQDNNRKGCNG